MAGSALSETMPSGTAGWPGAGGFRALGESGTAGTDGLGMPGSGQGGGMGGAAKA